MYINNPKFSTFEAYVVCVLNIGLFHHYCLQIQYATKFLVENVLSYLFDFCSHPVMPPIRSKRTVINHSTFTSNGGRGGGPEQKSSNSKHYLREY